MLDKFFQGVPIEVVFWGNMLVSIVGSIFIYGAPTFHRKLKLFLMLFWIGLALYYTARLSLQSATATRITAFLSPWEDYSIHPSHRFWKLLVILADVPLYMLCLGLIFDKLKDKKKAFKLSIIITTIFLIVWLLDFRLLHNTPSSMLAFAVFFYTAWSCRIEHITSSIIWITYALLHAPIGLAAAMPFAWRHTIFVVLLVSKLSLIAAMYSMLEVKKVSQS